MNIKRLWKFVEGAWAALSRLPQYHCRPHFIPTLTSLEDRCLLSGVFTTFRLSNPANSISAITSGPDGNLWFTEPLAGKVGRITLAGDIREFNLFPGSNPTDIAAGSDGNLWITD